MLAGTIERGMRTVFSTVSRTAGAAAPKLSISGTRKPNCKKINLKKIIISLETSK